jgi:hypothetical protein
VLGTEPGDVLVKTPVFVPVTPPVLIVVPDSVLVLVPTTVVDTWLSALPEAQPTPDSSSVVVTVIRLNEKRIYSSWPESPGKRIVSVAILK